MKCTINPLKYIGDPHVDPQISYKVSNDIKEIESFIIKHFSSVPKDLNLNDLKSKYTTKATSTNARHFFWGIERIAKYEEKTLSVERLSDGRIEVIFVNTHAEVKYEAKEHCHFPGVRLAPRDVFRTLTSDEYKEVIKFLMAKVNDFRPQIEKRISEIKKNNS